MLVAETFPDFQNGSGARFYGLGPGGQSYTRAEDFTFQENFTKVFSSHTFKAGYEMIRTRYNSLDRVAAQRRVSIRRHRISVPR